MKFYTKDEVEFVQYEIVVLKKYLKLNEERKEIFEILEKNHILTKFASEAMQKLVGFRNVAIHEYQPLNLNILCSIMKKYLTDFTDYTKEIIKFLKFGNGVVNNGKN